MLIIKSVSGCCDGAKFYSQTSYQIGKYNILCHLKRRFTGHDITHSSVRTVTFFGAKAWEYFLPWKPVGGHFIMWSTVSLTESKF